MTVPAGVARIQYFGSGSAGPFAFNFVLYDQTHLKITRTSLLGVDTVLALTTDYTVAIASDNTSATVTLIAPLAGTGLAGSSEKLTIVEDPPISQLVEWSRNDPFPFQTHQRAADLAVLLIGRLSERLNRAPLLAESSSFSNLTLPDPLATYFLRWNAAGDNLENVAQFSPGALSVSAYIQTLLDDANAATARATLGFREILSANRTYFVRADGNDSNTGLVNNAGGAFLTLNKAMQAIYALDLNGFNAGIAIADGTYAGGVTFSGMPIGWDRITPITVTGNTGTPANVIISTTSSSCFVAQNSAVILITGVEMRTTTSGDCLFATQNGQITHGNVRFGACANMHKEVADHGRIYNSGNYAISGGAVAHMHVTNKGYMLNSACTVTLSGTPAFSSFFIGVNGAYAQFNACVFAGTGATGQRFLVHENGCIFTSGVTLLTYFPGSVTGSLLGGGVFDDFNGNIFLLAGSAIDFGSGDVVVSHGANQLFFAGAASGYSFDNKVQSSAGGILSSAAAAKVGYTTGGGGTVTQLTNKTTTVTLNAPSGTITMNNASLASGASVIFQLTNSVLGQNDTIEACHNTAGGTVSAYAIQVLSSGAGACTLRVTNITGGALAEAVQINFNVHAGSPS